MTTTKRRAQRQQWNPDLWVLAARLAESIEAELFVRLNEDGHSGLRPRHGPIVAFLDEDGLRATELSRLTGRNKQVVGRLVDELEQLGYVERRPDPDDRRAKLIVPTAAGLEVVRLGDQVVAEIERRNAERIGRRSYAEFREALRRIDSPPPELRPIE